MQGGLKHQGLNLDFNPFISDEQLSGGPPEQQQQWPGREKYMRPKVDHGENSYKGGEKLRGKKALVTGGDSGIGRAVAIAFAREGADVAISYLEEHDDAKETLYWIEKEDVRGFSFSGDLSDPDYCSNLIDSAADRLGGLNILVNDAGVHFETTEFTDITPDQLEQTFKTNVFAFIWTTQNSLKYFQAGDSIINVGSVTALRGSKTLVDYACTKAAIHNLTKSLAQLLAPKGIRVNCVSPGPVWTPLIPSTRESEKIEHFGASTFWGRAAQPAEIAPSFVFLASADSRFYTGEIIAPTGYSDTTR